MTSSLVSAAFMGLYDIKVDVDFNTVNNYTDYDSHLLYFKEFCTCYISEQ